MEATEDMERQDVLVNDGSRTRFRERIGNYVVRIQSATKMQQKSFVWSYFGDLHLKGDGASKDVCGEFLDNQRFYCSLCLSDAVKENPNGIFSSCRIKSYKKSVSTSNLIAHLRDEHKVEDIQSKQKNINRVSKFFKVVPRERENGAKRLGCSENFVLARDIVLWFARDLLPFQKICGEGFQDFSVKYGIVKDPNDLPDRTALSRTALCDVYNVAENIVKHSLEESPDHGAVSMDLWTDNYRHRAYITFTYHCISTEYEMLSYTLQCKSFPERHTGENIRDYYYQVLDHFGLKNKTISVVSDKGSNILKACKLANVKHFSCVAHGLHNLLLNDGFETVEQVRSVIQKCRNIGRALMYKSEDLEKEVEKEYRDTVFSLAEVAHIMEADCEQSFDVVAADHAYPLGNAGTFAHGSQDENIPTNRYFRTIKKDMPTRWNSVLLMIESILRSTKSIDRLLEKLGKNDLKFHWTEFELLKELAEFLKTFAECSTIMQASSYPTKNLTVLFNSELKACFKVNDNDSEILRALKKNIENKFSDRFPIDDVCITAALLDPQLVCLQEITVNLKERNISKTDFLETAISSYAQIERETHQ